MSSWLSRCLVLCMCLALAQANSAVLVVQKIVHSEFVGVLGEGQNVTVEINIHNVGRGDAVDVQLTDPWSEELFQVVEGSNTASWQLIASGKHEQHNFTVAASKADLVVPGFPARVTYQPEPDAQTQVGKSSAMPTFRIIDKATFAKLTAKHYLEWVVFVVGMAAFALLPLSSYQTTAAEFPNGLPSSKKSS